MRVIDRCVLKEAEMIMARILGADMTLLFSLRFLINKSKGEKAVSRFYSFFILNCIFLRFLGGIIHAYQITVVWFFISELFTTAISYTCVLLNPNKRIRGRIE